MNSTRCRNRCIERHIYRVIQSSCSKSLGERVTVNTERVQRSIITFNGFVCPLRIKRSIPRYRRSAEIPFFCICCLPVCLVVPTTEVVIVIYRIRRLSCLSTRSNTRLRLRSITAFTIIIKSNSIRGHLLCSYNYIIKISCTTAGTINCKNLAIYIFVIFGKTRTYCCKFRIIRFVLITIMEIITNLLACIICFCRNKSIRKLINLTGYSYSLKVTTHLQTISAIKCSRKIRQGKTGNFRHCSTRKVKHKGFGDSGFYIFCPARCSNSIRNSYCSITLSC